MQKVFLYRKTDTGKETNGIIQFTTKEGVQSQCFTLELPWKNNQHDISCIPIGSYDCQWTFSPHLNRYTYEVLNVPNREGIRIHSGNFVSDLLGCIALGTAESDLNRDGMIDIMNSRWAIETFENIMDKQPFTLIISHSSGAG